MTPIPLVPVHRRLDLARLLLREPGLPAPTPRFVGRAEKLRDAPEHNLARVSAIARWLAEALGLPVEGEQAPPELAAYAATVCADLVRVDPARGEELVRTVLAARGRRPAGETPALARERLAALDSAAAFAHARACWAEETPDERRDELIAGADWLFRR